ncbi:MAG: helix-turn-helix domain-containing protein, partial [Ruminococcus sp.]|nr:helix-turn-helix domain-containing protein [Ruminococcus sp.]
SLIDLLVLGSEEEQQYARGKLQGLCNPYMQKKAKQLSLISSLEKTEQSAEESTDIFRGYFTQKIDIERKFTENSLADKIGCSASTISRIRSGEIRKPRKNRILQIGVALGLSADQLRQFVRSSGHSFPITKADVIILDCLENGITDYDKILYTASKYDAVLYIE